MQPDDAYWRRPVEGSPPPDSDWAQRPSHLAPTAPDRLPGHQAGMPNLIYHGPPVSTAPPAGWRPSHLVEPAPPRQLPGQDHAAIDDQEARARTLTLGVAIVAAAIMAILLFAVCGRALF